MLSPTLLAKLEKRREAMARETAARIRRTVPRYADFDEEVLLHTASTLFAELPRLLASDHFAELPESVELIAEMRKAHDFTAGEFLMAVLCGMPSLRHFLAEELGSAEATLEAYDMAEARLLPVFGAMVNMYDALAGPDLDDAVDL